MKDCDVPQLRSITREQLLLYPIKSANIKQHQGNIQVCGAVLLQIAVGSSEPVIVREIPMRPGMTTGFVDIFRARFWPSSAFCRFPERPILVAMFPQESGAN